MIRIVIADDQGMVLGALSSLLNMEEDFAVVCMAVNGQEAVSLIKELVPDVCVMDIEMLVKTVLDATEDLIGNNCKEIIHTTFACFDYFVRAQQAEVRGYILKDSSIQERADAIRMVMSGRHVFAPELEDTILHEHIKENALMGKESDVLHFYQKKKQSKKVLINYR